MGREIALLMVPLFIIGGVALWRGRNDAPEDLWSGKARVVNRVRVIEATPFERYRGYTHRIEIDQWAAGDLPPLPPPRPGTLKSYRWFSLGYPPLQVAFRQGKTWKRTLPCDEISRWEDKKQLKASQVAPEIASLWIAMGGGANSEREMARMICLLRLPESPRVEEAVLIGHTEAELQDRDDRMVGGVHTGDIVRQHKLVSDAMRVPLELKNDVAQNDVAPKELVREPGWEMKEVTTMPPDMGSSSQLRVNLRLRHIGQGTEAGRITLVGGRLLNATGRQIGSVNSYSWGQGGTVKGEKETDVSFDMTPKLWKKVAKPLTFQAIVSVNDGWPLEVNVELGKENAVLPPKKSKLPFIREPLPLR